jgi:signal transduction histidine kinase
LNAPDDSFVLGRRVALLYRNVLLGQIVSLVNATVLTGVALSLLDNPVISVWWLAAVLIAGFRVMQAKAYNGESESARQADAANWRRRVLYGVAASGLIWAAGGLLLMSQGNTHLQLFTAFVIAGMVAGAVPVLAADRTVFRAYAWPMTLAAIVGSLGNDPLHIAFTVMAVIFLLAVTRSADLFHDTLHDTFRLEHEKDHLVENLDRAREVAERSNRAKTEFLANISHELRTPMNGIIGMADLLALETINDDQRELLDHLRDSADILLLQLNHLIELSALEAGHVRLRPEPFVVHDLLDGLLSAQHKAATSKGLTIAIDADPALPGIVVGDLDHLRQVFQHLVGNAIKFTDRGRIEIAARQVERTGKTVRIEFAVTDTGPGISAEALQAINGLLVQGDGSSIRRHGGLGVGLPIVRRLIELMGSELQIDSELGKGSTFRFTLPFALPEIASAASPA